MRASARRNRGCKLTICAHLRACAIPAGNNQWVEDAEDLDALKEATDGMTRPQRASFHELFQEMNIENDDAVLTRQEVVQALEHIHIRDYFLHHGYTLTGNNDADADHIVSVMDKDGNGSISVLEFAGGSKALSNAAAKRQGHSWQQTGHGQYNQGVASVRRSSAEDDAQKQLLALLENDADNKVEEAKRELRKAEEARRLLKEQNEAAAKIQGAFRGQQRRKSVKIQEQDRVEAELLLLVHGDQVAAASKIQAQFRGHKARKDLADGSIKPPKAKAIRKVVLDRSNGRRLGVGFGSAEGPTSGVPIMKVDPREQASGVLAVKEHVLAINGINVRGMSFSQVAEIVMSSETVELTMQGKNTNEEHQAAGKIQGAFRGAQRRKSLTAQEEDRIEAELLMLVHADEEAAASKIQAQFRGHQVRKSLANGTMKPGERAPPPPQAPAEPDAVAISPVRKVVLDRSGGKRLGIGFGSASSATTGVPIMKVDPREQASGLLKVHELVLEVNGTSVRGMTFSQVAEIVMSSETVELTVQTRTRASQLHDVLADLSGYIMTHVHAFNGDSDDTSIDLDEWRKGCKTHDLARKFDMVMQKFPEVKSVDMIFEKLHEADAEDQRGPLSVLQIVKGFGTMHKRILVERVPKADVPKALATPARKSLADGTTKPGAQQQPPPPPLQSQKPLSPFQLANQQQYSGDPYANLSPSNSSAALNDVAAAGTGFSNADLTSARASDTPPPTPPPRTRQPQPPQPTAVATAPGTGFSDDDLADAFEDGDSQPGNGDNDDNNDDDNDENIVGGFKWW